MMKHKKKVVALAAVSALVVGSAMSGSAFFTDKEVVTQKSKVGTMDMVVRDLSDLDGQYREWGGNLNFLVNQEQAAEDRLSKFQYAAGYQGGNNDFASAVGDLTIVDPYDKDAPSMGIINPGDTGLLAFTIRNAREKSFDVAIEVTVESTISFTDGADEYTIDGLGTPAKSADGKTLTYLKVLDTFDGSVEKETGGKDNEQEHLYVYHVDFARDADEKFMDADFTVTTNIYAKQHRNSVKSDFYFDSLRAGNNPEDGTSWSYADGKKITGDWTLIDQKIDLGDNSGNGGGGDITITP